MFELAAVIALAVLFLHTTTWEGMIFEKVADFLQHMPEWFKKPLYDCPMCMAPWWGGWFLFCGWFVGDIELTIFKAVMIILCAGGINAVLPYFFSIMQELMTVNQQPAYSPKRNQKRKKIRR